MRQMLGAGGRAPNRAKEGLSWRNYPSARFRCGDKPILTDVRGDGSGISPQSAVRFRLGCFETEAEATLSPGRNRISHALLN
jgi:hypothetical protein